MSTTRIFYVLCFGFFISLLSTAVCFRFTRTPDKPLVVYFRNRTNVELRWEWTLSQGEVVSPIKIKRYRKNVANTETILATYFNSANADTTKYSFTVANNLNGYASFVIKDIINQGLINVMADDEVYIYKIGVDEQTTAKEYTDEVELNTFKTPSITKYPRNQTASGGTVTFECTADGKPTPTITWEKIGSFQGFSQGSPLTITHFDTSKVGVYRCTAKSIGIAENATATGYVQFSTCESGCSKEEFGIEFTELTYNYEYESPSYNKYKELKNKVETECLIVYAIKGKAIRKCEVLRFRRGSVVAVVELGWPTNILGAKQPLMQAIRNGTFAGYKVKTDFVSPTAPSPIDPTSRTPKDSSVGSITREEGEDAVFLFNASTRILEVLWGIRDGNTSSLIPVLIAVDTFSGVRLNSNLNSSSYAGRVSFVGDLSKGQIWFKITNLNINDTNQYMAQIRTEGSLCFRNIFKKLTVLKSAINECASNPCLNEGTCIDLVNGFSCRCSHGWQGQDCSKNFTECAPNPCMNGGNCTDLVNGFSCRCAHGWEGHNCTKNINECSSNPCMNGGNCTDLVNGYNCTCAPGWGGQNCNKNVNECASNPCLNEGTCTDLVNGFNCTCAPGWQGQNCTKTPTTAIAVRCTTSFINVVITIGAALMVLHILMY